MVNVNKLKGKIVENGMSFEEFANRLSISRSALYRKFSRGCESVTIKEAGLMAKELKLTSEEAAEIFFTHGVA